LDEAAAMQGNGRDDRLRSSKESTHATDKALRHALHLPDLIDKIDLSRIETQAIGRPVNRLHVDAVLPDTVDLGKVHVSDDALGPVESN
jgi:hypothetical protein